MAVPGHDERDFEFASVFDLPIVRVVASDGVDPHGVLPEAFTQTENVHLVNSGQFNGLGIEDAKDQIVAWLEANGHAHGVVNYRLHD